MNTRTFAFQLFGTGIAFAAMGPIAFAQTGDRSLKESLQPLLAKYCLRCHSGEKPRAGVRLDKLEEPRHSEKVTATWKDVIDQLALQKMPPEDEPQPSDADRDKMVSAIQDAVRLALRLRQSTGGRALVRRLSQREYENTVADLLHLPKEVVQQATRNFPPDGEAFGFDNIATTLDVTGTHLLKYGEAADFLLEHALLSGPRPKSYSYEMIPYVQLLKNRERDLAAAKKYIESGEKERLSRNQATVKRLTPLIPKQREEIEKFGPRPWYIRPRMDNLPRIVGSSRVENLVGKDFVGKVLQDENGKPIKSYNDFHIGSALSFPGSVSVPVSGYYKISAKLGRSGESKFPQTFVMSADKGQKNDWRRLVSWQVDTPLSDIAKSHYESTVYLQRGSYGIWCTEDITWQREVFRAGELTGKVHLLSFKIDGPIVKHWPPASFSSIYFKGSDAGMDRECARDILARFARRAFRRPLHDGELARLLATYDLARKNGVPFDAALRGSLRNVLTSPSFLYLVEFPADAKKSEAFVIDDHALASRLSYFLWGTMPDQTLFDLADKNQLHEPKALHQQVERMLGDARAEGFLRGFVRQWLSLKPLELRNPDLEKYPNFDEHLRVSMLKETDAFFMELLNKNLSIENLVVSDFAMVNERLALHYGIPDVRGDAIRKVKLPVELHRGGLLGQASVLTATSTDVRTSPVARGAFVLEKLLGYPRPIPPANVPDLAEVPDEKDGKLLTIAEKMDLHRRVKSCSNCHARIDPLGLALENFDAIGAWRSDAGHPSKGGGWRKGNPIDATGTLPRTKVAFKNPTEFRAALMKTEGKRVTQGLTENLLTFALARGLELTDQEAVDALVETSHKQGNGFRDLIHLVTQSALFRRK